jgi:hypothetical protein
MKNATTNADRAASLALNSASNFLACIAEGRKPGVKSAREALRLIRKSHAQIVRIQALLAVS